MTMTLGLEPAVLAAYAQCFVALVIGIIAIYMPIRLANVDARRRRGLLLELLKHTAAPATFLVEAAAKRSDDEHDVELLFENLERQLAALQAFPNDKAEDAQQLLAKIHTQQNAMDLLELLKKFRGNSSGFCHISQDEIDASVVYTTAMTRSLIVDWEHFKR
ncbi:hypothetical protein XaraCFBP7407_16400 [Xanthomonas arboricola pv. arracaciae]|uniref:hypothetical protein n=1 Tax=Xanthomonas arboricola TaxID=56448 RepID=UPI000CEE0C66|nr:hypothetical protein [Xanthomonas arboricola]PPT93945.1 hypothetical protein XaraCFBP7407_16400 [Xanthomonas arboricola pv. arracaciae]